MFEIYSNVNNKDLIKLELVVRTLAEAQAFKLASDQVLYVYNQITEEDFVL